MRRSRIGQIEAAHEVIDGLSVFFARALKVRGVSDEEVEVMVVMADEGSGGLLDELTHVGEQGRPTGTVM